MLRVACGSATVVAGFAGEKGGRDGRPRVTEAREFELHLLLFGELVNPLRLTSTRASAAVGELGSPVGAVESPRSACSCLVSS